MNSWYTSWFNERYLQLYQHRDQEEANAQIAFLLSHTKPQSVLDVACGSGRHLRAFQNASCSAFGIDRSMPLLLQGANPYSCCADMRALPFPDGSFDLLTSFFTSFGYFDSDAEHRALLREWRRVLVPGAPLFIDYLNPDYLEANLIPESSKQHEQMLVKEKRRIAGGRIIKDIEVQDLRSGVAEHYRESVLLYRFEALCALADSVGFSISASFGDFSGATFAPESPRMLLLFHRREC